jgi:hypothetical protein
MVTEIRLLPSDGEREVMGEEGRGGKRLTVASDL